VLVTGVVLALYTVLAVCMIASRRAPSRVAYDQRLYHEDAVRQFAAQWPAIDVWDYQSATTPGYHVTLGLVARYVSDERWALQCAGMLWTGLFMGLWAWVVGRRAPWPMAIALALPMVLSNYQLLPGAFLLPDAAGWLGVLAILAIALRPRVTAPWLVACGAILVYTVLMRQIHAWTAGLVLASTWLSTPANDDEAPGEPPLAKQLFGDLGPRVRRTLIAIACIVPAAVLLFLFLRYWGGLVPPRFQEWYRPRTPTQMALSPSLVYLLAVVGAYSPFYAASWFPALVRAWNERRDAMLLIAAAGVVAALIPPTAPDYDEGRRTALWELAKRFPIIADRWSLLMIGLAVLGSIVLGALLLAQRPRQRLILLAAFLGMAAALSASVEVWQRYTEALVLMVVTIACCHVAAESERTADAGEHRLGSKTRRGGGTIRAARVAGPALLGVVLGLGTLRLMTRNTLDIDGPPPPAKAPDHHGLFDPPVLKPRPEKPAGRSFWPG